MDKRVLLISSQKSFMVNAMIKNLNSASYEVVHRFPDEDFSGAGGLPSVVLLYLDEDAGQMKEFLNNTREHFLDDDGDRRFVLIGTDEELDSIKQALSGKVIEGEFKRPLNAGELVEKLNEMFMHRNKDNREGDHRKRILVVDDDGTMLRTLKLWLSDRYQIYMANSGANALTLLETKEVDLVLLDYEMPVASGPEVLKMIRSNPAICDLPVMFLTAKNDKESVMSVADLKPEKYLFKTMSPDVLLQNIDDFFLKQ